MKTIWGEQLDHTNVLLEYPRPQLVRTSYHNLNGFWQYAITDDEKPPVQFDGQILVPFSPESELSGVLRTLAPSQTLWYQTTVSLPSDYIVDKVLLHFGAVDQMAKVYVNDTLVCEHVGGYTPFFADITSCLQRENIIRVQVRDFSDYSSHSRGKQKSKRGGIWYTAQSGIWQTVWLESVPDDYIVSLKMTPLFDEGVLELTVISENTLLCVAKLADQRTFTFLSNTPTHIDMPDFISWTPEHPHLYDVSIEMGEDVVTSYFGMRKFSVDTDGLGIKRLFLNNEPYFHNGLLDQGYYSDGMYTPPSDEAMIFDIQTAKDMSFNMLRKHIKIEPLRWYYHCDRLGMLVWQDMINGGESYHPATVLLPAILNFHINDHHYKVFSRSDKHGRDQYYKELDEVISHLYNCTSLAMWVPFNEGWGQFDAGEAVKFIQQRDSTRTIDHASGWHDQGIGDIRSWHVYFRKYRFQSDKLGRAVALSEFGGFNLRIEGHSFNDKDFGYKRLKSKEALQHSYCDLYENEVIPAIQKGLCAAVYTQLSDVEDELNGLITYDRKVIKLPIEILRQINETIGFKSF